MDGQALLVVVIIAAVCFFLIKQGWDQSMQQQNEEQRLRSHYRLQDVFVSSDGFLIGLNFEEQKIVLRTVGKPETVYGFSQISSVEVIENEVTITSTNRGSQILGTVVGSLFGPVGSVIGGLSGSSRSRGRLRDIALRVFVDDPANPAFRISFFHSSKSKGIDPDDPQARDARSKVDRFHAHLLNAMRQAHAPQQITNPASFSGTAELKTLWEMKQAGALTEEEFVQQKAHLLANGVENPQI